MPVWNKVLGDTKDAGKAPEDAAAQRRGPTKRLTAEPVSGTDADSEAAKSEYADAIRKRNKAFLRELAAFDASEGLEYIQSSLEHQAVDDAGGSFERHLDNANRIYSQQLMLMTIMPLMRSRGNDPRAMEEALGTGLACYMMDPHFRESVNGMLKKLDPRQKFAKHIEERSQSDDPDWTRARDAFAKSGERLPLTPKSAGMLYVGLSKTAYEEMRVPGADIEAINKQYKQNIDGLREVALHDGLSETDFNQGVRQVYGSLCKQDPTLEHIFSETSMNLVKRGPGRTESIWSPNKVVWKGDYVNTITGQPFDGRFTLRKPYEPDEHTRQMASHIKDGFARCKDYSDFRALCGTPIQRLKWEQDEGFKPNKWLESWRRSGDRIMNAAFDDNVFQPKQFSQMEDAWEDICREEAEKVLSAHPEWDAMAEEDKIGRYFSSRDEDAIAEDLLFSDCVLNEDGNISYSPVVDDEFEGRDLSDGASEDAGLKKPDFGPADRQRRLKQLETMSMPSESEDTPERSK